MKVNLKGLLTSAGQEAGGHFRHTLPELYDNLVELRERTQKGDMAAIDEFFALYVIHEQAGKSGTTSSAPPASHASAP